MKHSGGIDCGGSHVCANSDRTSVELWYENAVDFYACRCETKVRRADGPARNLNVTVPSISYKYSMKQRGSFGGGQAALVPRKQGQPIPLSSSKKRRVEWDTERERLIVIGSPLAAASDDTTAASNTSESSPEPQGKEETTHEPVEEESVSEQEELADEQEEPAPHFSEGEEENTTVSSRRRSGFRSNSRPCSILNVILTNDTDWFSMPDPTLRRAAAVSVTTVASPSRPMSPKPTKKKDVFDFVSSSQESTSVVTIETTTPPKEQPSCLSTDLDKARAYFAALDRMELL